MVGINCLVVCRTTWQAVVCAVAVPCGHVGRAMTLHSAQAVLQSTRSHESRPSHAYVLTLFVPAVFTPDDNLNVNDKLRKIGSFLAHW